MIERTFAEQLDLTADDVRLIEDVNGNEGVSWLFSFLSADRRRTCRLYEAPSPEAIVAAACGNKIPVDEIVEVSRLVPSELLAAPPAASLPVELHVLAAVIASGFPDRLGVSAEGAGAYGEGLTRVRIQARGRGGVAGRTF